MRGRYAAVYAVFVTAGCGGDPPTLGPTTGTTEVASSSSTGDTVASSSGGADTVRRALSFVQHPPRIGRVPTNLDKPRGWRPREVDAEAVVAGGLV